MSWFERRIKSIGVLFTWTAASALCAAGAESGTLAPQKTAAVERNATAGWQVGYAEADITPASGEDGGRYVELRVHVQQFLSYAGID